jgi:hypothetical protein
MTLAAFGPFALAFEKDGLRVPGYLTLLHLGFEQDVQVVIDRIQQAMADDGRQRWVDALLAERDWRPHLPAAIAFLLDRRSLLARDSLWRAIDSASWVTPQLVVAAFFSDPQFVARASVRLERYSAGPNASDDDQPSAKVVASLIGASALIPELNPSVERWRENPAIESVLLLDAAWDRSEGIVLTWMAAVKRALASRNIELSAPR